MFLNRRSFLSETAVSAFAATTPVRAAAGREFDIASTDGSPIRNFRIDGGRSPKNLSGVILAGSPDAQTVLFEFFDYACPYCRVASQDLDVLIGSTAGARLGLVQNPVLSSRSVDAARVTLAAARLHGDAAGYRLHTGIFEAPGRTSAGKALDVARAQGLNFAALAELAERDEIAAILHSQMERARALSLRFTPSFVLGDFAFVGWPGAERIQTFVEATQRCGGLKCPQSN